MLIGHPPPLWFPCARRACLSFAPNPGEACHQCKVACAHADLRADVFDPTLGVTCQRCGESFTCWEDEHASEAQWNRAVKGDARFRACAENREDACFLCGTALGERAP